MKRKLKSMFAKKTMLYKSLFVWGIVAVLIAAGCSPPKTTTTTTTMAMMEYDYHRWADRVHPDDLARVEEQMRISARERRHFASMPHQRLFVELLSIRRQIADQE